MTWIIGRAGPFGHAIGISDIRVTINNMYEVDCLQKIYRIAGNLALGFAGSVPVGLEVKDQIIFALDPMGKNISYNPMQIEDLFSDGLRKIFSKFKKKIANPDTQFLLFSAHPTENDGPAPWAKCFVHRFCSPYFLPEIAYSGRIVSIGSGSMVSTYQTALEKLNDDIDIFKIEVDLPGGSGLLLMNALTRILNETPTNGISQYLQTVLVGRRSVRISNNATMMNHNLDGDNKMPRLAHNWEELEEILHDKNINSILEARC